MALSGSKGLCLWFGVKWNLATPMSLPHHLHVTESRRLLWALK